MKEDTSSIVRNFQHPFNWKPVPHSVIKDVELKERIHIDGMAVVPFLSEDQLTQLRSLNDQMHQLDHPEGGMFYSLYSHDYDYRKKVHDTIQEILQPSLDRYFKDYKNVINTFVIKASGPQSEFGIHQDTTAMDEFTYSPLSVWIPLHDITKENGAMCVIKKSHHFFSPYRGISFPFPTHKINDTVRKYLEPIEMKAGEVMLLDPRILHNSLENKSGKDRVSIVSGVFPTEAKFVICYKEPSIDNAPIELFSQEEDFLLKYPNFFHHCHSRPVTGKVIGHADFDFPAIEEADFVSLCSRFEIPELNALPAPPPPELNCNMISEPVSA